MGYGLLWTIGLWYQFPCPPSWWIKNSMGYKGLWVMRMVTVESWLEIRIPGEIGKFSVTLDTLNT